MHQEAQAKGDCEAFSKVIQAMEYNFGTLQGAYDNDTKQFVSKIRLPSANNCTIDQSPAPYPTATYECEWTFPFS